VPPAFKFRASGRLVAATLLKPPIIEAESARAAFKLLRPSVEAGKIVDRVEPLTDLKI
jgi:hypothetical protein